MTKPRPVPTELKALSAAIHTVTDPARPGAAARNCAYYDALSEACMAPVPQVYSWGYLHRPRVTRNMRCPEACPCFRRRT